MPATARLTLPGTSIQSRAYGNSSWVRGGETLDPVVTTGTDAGAIFNAANIEAASGSYWGVMALTLNPNGYKWDFESALKDPAQTSAPATYSDKGFGTCHGSGNRD
jgi:acid phosphatase type 7